MHLPRTILALCGALAVPLLPTAAGAQPSFEPALRLQLPREVNVEFDGAGQARVLWGEDVVARIDLLLADRGEEHLAPALRSLSAAAGATLLQRDLLAVELGEDLEGGAPGIDDDADGRVDEDPFDGLDNDGDGRRDEDFAAIGHRMRMTLADLSGAGLPPAVLRGQLSQWPYAHVDDILFWNATVEFESTRAGNRAALRVLSPHEVVFSDERIEPHVALGKATARRVRFLWLRAEDVDGRRLYVAVVRLDGEPSQALAAGDGVVWRAKPETVWPLAIVVAPTQDALRFSVGQALLTYRASTEGAPAWKVPPLCARCQPPDDLQAAVHLAQNETDLVLTVTLDPQDRHGGLSAEGTSFAGIPLAAYVHRFADASAVFRLPLESLDAQQVVAAAVGDHGRLTIAWSHGQEITPARVDIEAEPGLRHAAAGSAPETDFPTHLAPRLLQTWPNPFQQTTTIRYEVPATLGEAFEFEPDDERVQRLDLQAPAPFGPNPVVRVRVYNVGGQLIRILGESVGRVGRHSISWDGTDEQGTPVAAGAYYVNVEMGDYRVTRRVLRLNP